jgi:hypothetical protein
MAFLMDILFNNRTVFIGLWKEGLVVETGQKCEWLVESGSENSCKLRNLILSQTEVREKCKVSEKAVLCVDAYKSLYNGQEAIQNQSTDAFPWLLESANQFENLGETDNAVQAIVRAINLATRMNLIDKGYEFFRYARAAYEHGIARGDPSLKNPTTKDLLVKAGKGLVAASRKLAEGTTMSDFQAELKAGILGGISLKKAQKDEASGLISVDGRQLYAKKSSEYKEGAETYIESGMIGNAVTFACMGALADLMLGKPKDGLVYLTKFVNDSGKKEKIHANPCFQWTKLLFSALVNKNTEAIEKAKTLFFQIAWSFKDDKLFAQRVMDSVERRLSM